MRVDRRALGLAPALALAGCSIVFQGDEHQANLGRDGAVPDDGGRTDGPGVDGATNDAIVLDGGGLDGTTLDSGGDAGPPPPGRVTVLGPQMGLLVRFQDELATTVLAERMTDASGAAFYDYGEGDTGVVSILYSPNSVTSFLGVPAGSTVDVANPYSMTVGTTAVTFPTTTGATRYVLANGCGEVDPAAPAGAMILTESRCVMDGEVELALFARNAVFELLRYQMMRVSSPPPASLTFPDAWMAPMDMDVTLENTVLGAPYYPGVAAFFGQVSLWGQAGMAVGTATPPIATFTVPLVGDAYRLQVEHRDVGEPVLGGSNFFARGRTEYLPDPMATVFDVNVLPERITGIEEDAGTHEVMFSTTLVGDWVKISLSFTAAGSWTIFAPGDMTIVAPPMPFTGTPLETSPTTESFSIEVIDRSDFTDYGTVLARRDREGIQTAGEWTSYTRFDARE